jgi:hypothetical protein
MAAYPNLTPEQIAARLRNVARQLELPMLTSQRKAILEAEITDLVTLLAAAKVLNETDCS